MKKSLLALILMMIITRMMFSQNPDYLCFTAVNGPATVKLTAVGNNVPTVSLQYSTNKTSWSAYTIDQVISLASGGKIYFRATSSNARLASYSSSTYTYSYHKFVMTGHVAASGKITSLISNQTTSKVVNTYAYTRLFEGCTSLISAPELPATTLAAECYKWMFSGCTGLTAAPELPATVMAPICYCGMFMNCTGLISAPNLPATIMADNCYCGMFMDCTGLTTAPTSLPATTLATNCYNEMFSGCTSLTVAPELPATTLAYQCYFFMFYNCTSLTTPPSSLPATAMAEEACWSMFSGCTSLQTTPQLPATTLAKGCYQWMFATCSSLTDVPALPATVLTPSCYKGMFSGCSNIRLNLAAPGTVWKIPAAAASSAFSASSWGTDMFKNTGGTMTGQPTPGQNYYIGNSTPAPATAVITVNIQGQGTVSGAGTYNVGDTVTLTATPASGYTFASWNTGSTSATISFVATGDATITACFEQQLGYLCFTAVNGPATIKLTSYGNAPSVSLQYSTNGTSWSSYSLNQTISLSSGNKVYFKATSSNSRFANYFSAYNYFVMTGQVAASGDITSLISSNMSKTSVSSYCYCFLFENCTSLISVPELPATTLAECCYFGLFKGCTGLTVAPLLPVTTLAERCYEKMFEGCSSLSSAPTLPATIMEVRCYAYMFKDCIGLEVPPNLPATTLASHCFSNMFEGCTGLTTAPILPVTTLAECCYSHMFKGCTGLTAAPALPATVMRLSCYDSMFDGCTALTAAPALPATTLDVQCYWGMFRNCTALTAAPVLPATTLAQSCYWQMFKGCTGLTSPPALPATTLALQCYTSMFENCSNIKLNLTGTGNMWKIPAAAATSAASTSNWGSNMFTGTGGTLQGQPVPGQDYYDQNAQPTQIPDYLCFTAVNGPATIKLTGVLTSPPSISLQYSTNGTSWSSYTIGQTISLTSGSKVYFRATNTNYSLAYLNIYSSNQGYHRFVMTGTIAASGNVISLLDKTMATTSLNKWAFAYLFSQCTSLITPPELPATSLAEDCYLYMFHGCSNLTSAPELPALIMDTCCYDNMFANCTSLTTPPALPATTMAYECYGMMFEGCTGLTSAPALPATVMADRCYYKMFEGCTALTTAPALPAMTLGKYCYCRMFVNCSSLTTVPNLPATLLDEYCYANMFDGCSNIRLYPTGSGTIWKIPAGARTATQWGTNMFTGTGGTLQGQPVIGQNYYYNQTPTTGTVTVTANGNGTVTGGGTYNVGSMVTLIAVPDSGYVFSGWSNGLTNSTITIQVGGDTTITANFEQMLDYLCFTAVNGPATIKLTSTGNAPSVSLQYLVSGTPQWQTYTINQTITLSLGDKVYFRATNTNARMASGLFSANQFVMTGRVAASGDVTSLLDKTLTTKAVNTYTFHWLFYGCTSLISAPEMPATTLSSYCYCRMFENCSSLLTASELPATTLAANCYDCMFQGCSSLTAAPELPATTLASGCYNSMFEGCTTLTIAPQLPATTLAAGCYTDMFRDCSNIKLNLLGPGNIWKIPAAAASSASSIPNWGSNMFTGSGGTLQGQPTVGRDYYYEGTYLNVSVNVIGSGTVTGAGVYSAGDTVFLTATPAVGWYFTGWSNGATDSAISFVATVDTTLNANFAAYIYDVVATANPVNGGTVSGAGQYSFGSSVTLTAIPDVGYHFTCWSNGMTSTSISFTVTGDTTLVASFAQNIYTVAGASNPAKGGVVTGSGTYTHGSNVTLTATAVNGYRFTGWSNGATTNPISFVATGDTTLTANFVPVNYNVTVMANPANGGTVSGGGVYGYGTIATVTATPATGYSFTGWSNGMTTNTIPFLVTGDTVLVANFVQNAFVVTATANPTNGGVVAGAGNYAYGSTATLTATPAMGYLFTGWSNGTTSPTLSFTVSGDTSFVAYFVQNVLTVSLMANPSNGGTVTGSGTYAYGSAITMTATPAAGFRFTGWSDGTTASSISTVVTDNISLTANFERITCTVTTIVDPAMTGSISGGGTYYYGDTVTLVASAATGYEFIGWHSTGQTGNVIQFVVTGDTVVIANFIMTTYTVTVTTNDQSGGVVEGGGVYAAGDTAIISVTVADGYYFTGWSNGETSSTISVVVAGDTTLTALFERYEHILTVMVNDTAYGKVKVSGSYYHEDVVTLTAISDVHTRLAYWSTGDTASVIQVVLTSDTTIEAFFEWDEYVVTALSNDSACGMAYGSGVFRYGSIAELTAVAEEGCRFVSWSDGSVSDTIHFAVVSNIIMTAYFENVEDVGVENTEAPEYIVYSEGLNIFVNGAENRRITVYDMAGRSVEIIDDAVENQRIEIYSAGVYQIMVDEFPAARIVVK